MTREQEFRKQTEEAKFESFAVMCKKVADLEQENEILAKALNLYINWADECGVAWDNFPDMEEKWWKIVEEKGLGWIEGLTFMVMEEAKEQLKKGDR